MLLKRLYLPHSLHTGALCIARLMSLFLLLGIWTGALAMPDLPAVDSAIAPSAEANHNPITWPDNPLVYRLELAEDIMPPALRRVQRAMEEAHAANADVFLLLLDTYGGMVNIADSISQRLLHAKMPTLVYITNNAASAGALISISCDSIYMAPSSQIGAATVVNGTDGQAMPDKYQAYMRAKMRSIAERQHRDPDIAQAMVDQDIAIEGLIEAGKTLVFTPSEALANGYCEGVADTWQEALEMAGVRDYTLQTFTPTAVDNIVSFLLNPIVSGILLMVIFFGIYAELQSPGVGFPLIAAAIAATLYFAPHYLDGLAAEWEIAVFVVGVLLLAVELFVLPGFGIAGITGAALMITSLILSLLANNNLTFDWVASGDLVRALLTVILALFGAAGLIATMLGSLGASPLLRRLVLVEAQNRERGFRVDSYQGQNDLMHQTGQAVTDLRPAGKIALGDMRYDALTEGGFIDAGQTVTVVAVRGNYLLVRSEADASLSTTNAAG